MNEASDEFVATAIRSLDEDYMNWELGNMVFRHEPTNISFWTAGFLTIMKIWTPVTMSLTRNQKKDLKDAITRCKNKQLAQRLREKK